MHSQVNCQITYVNLVYDYKQKYILNLEMEALNKYWRKTIIGQLVFRVISGVMQ